MENLYKLKEEFLSIWSVEKVKQMTLEQYTNLNKEDSFCYWLESKSTRLGGFGGGSSYKFGIYKRSNTSKSVDADNRRTDGVYAWFIKYGETKEDAFQSIKNIILEIIDAVNKNNIEKIDEINLGDAYKWKIAFLYSDFTVLNIFKYEALKFLSIKNGFDFYKKAPISVFQMFLLSLKQNDEDYFDFSHKLWRDYENANKVEISTVNKRKLLFINWLKLNSLSIEIADELDELSEKVLLNGDFNVFIYDCVDIYNIYQLQFQEPISENWESLYKYYYHFSIDQIKNETGIDLSIKYALVKITDINELNYFIENGIWNNKLRKNTYESYLNKFTAGNKIAIIDYIDGKTFIKVSGTIINYSVSGNVSQFKVNWDLGKINFPVNLSRNPGILDFFEIEPGNYSDGFNDIKKVFYNTNDYLPKMKQPLNQILYGPPGTGKTYSLNSFLKENNQKEIEKKNEDLNVNESKVFWHLAPGQGGFLWNKLKKGDRLGYQWCDNDEGDLKLLKREETDNFSIKHYFSWVKKGDYFCIISGKKFYGIAEALENYDFKNAITDDFAFQTIPIKWIKIFETPELLNASYTPTFGQLNGGKRWESLIKALNENNIFLNSQKKESIENNKKPLNYIFSTFHQSFSYEDFIEGIKPDIENSDDLSYGIEDGVFKIACDKAANIAGFEDLNDALNSTKEEVETKFKDAEPFYLLIDEINRGNVSAIFGELITLIEEDKRLGKKNETKLTLPYSKKEFGVPPNLFIIGTMNTADRSVEALDTALRRRFSFVEMMPKYDDLERNQFYGFTLKEVLKTINERIEALLDRDHTIGHSYFININSGDTEALESAFMNKIIPLLQEYFYHDYGKIALILGEGFVNYIEPKNNTVTFAKWTVTNNITIPEITPQFELKSKINNIEEAVELLLKR